jgi:hypothetical protein
VASLIWHISPAYFSEQLPHVYSKILNGSPNSGIVRFPQSRPNRPNFAVLRNSWTWWPDQPKSPLRRMPGTNTVAIEASHAALGGFLLLGLADEVS